MLGLLCPEGSIMKIFTPPALGPRVDFVCFTTLNCFQYSLQENCLGELIYMSNIILWYYVGNICNTSLVLWKHQVNLIMGKLSIRNLGFSSVLIIQELSLLSFAIINLRGVSTKLS